MTIRIVIGDPHHPEATALLEASHALMESLFPSEANHYLSIDALTAPHIRFFVAEVGGVIKGCAALALMDGYGEVKSMFVDPGARGMNLGARLLDRIEKEAREARLPVLMLETGDTLKAAHKLYENQGFAYCGPFGDYREAPTSLFMEKPLS